MKNPTKLFFPILMPLLLLAGCYYPYYEEGAAAPAQPTTSVTYSGYLYSGWAWPGYYWPYSYYGPAYYSYYGLYPYGSLWRSPPPRYYYPPRRWQSAPPYRPSTPSYRPDGPRSRPEWRGGRGDGPRPASPPAFRPDGPRFQPQSDRQPDSFTPMTPGPRGRR